MVKKKNPSAAASSTSGGAATKSSSILSKEGALSAPPPAPAPPAPLSSAARPGDWTGSTVTKRDEKRSRSLGLISSDEGNVIFPAAEETGAPLKKRSIGGFADEDDLLDIDEAFVEPPPKRVRSDAASPAAVASEASVPKAAPASIDCFLPFQRERCSCCRHSSSFCKSFSNDLRGVISSLEAFASQFTSLEAEEAKSTSSKLDGAIKKAAIARQEVDSLKEALNKLKEKLKDEEARSAEKDDLLRQSALALLEAASILATALDSVPNNSPANGVSMALASHQLTRELLNKGKGALARMHSMIFPKVKQEKTLGQLIDAFAVDTKETIEVFKRTSRTYGALLAFQLMMGYGFKADIEEMTKELPKEKDGRSVDLSAFTVSARTCARQLLALVSSEKTSVAPAYLLRPKLLDCCFPGAFVFDDSSGVLPESDRSQRMKDRIAQMEKDLCDTYALAAIVNKKSEIAANDRVQQVHHFFDKCYKAMRVVWKTMFPLNAVPPTLLALMSEFGNAKKIRDLVRAQVFAGARFTLALVLARYPSAGLLSIANATGDLEALYPKVLLPTNIIVDILEKDSTVPEERGTPQG
ncbi:hypothetical protein QYE76_005465 [Lolium multiflorum]|uniref:Uncharacterized protein n=1 Tax=Lolium multiflorum TaxID=4521 RepID=A0AAD8RTW6_LOLMU|nr:hypothetical protein QYE76_005465 [Lolium multiflorum]